MKTLMLDCRDQRHRPQHDYLKEDQGGSHTDRTYGDVDID